MPLAAPPMGFSLWIRNSRLLPRLYTVGCLESPMGPKTVQRHHRAWRSSRTLQVALLRLRDLAHSRLLAQLLATHFSARPLTSRSGPLIWPPQIIRTFRQRSIANPSQHVVSDRGRVRGAGAGPSHHPGDSGFWSCVRRDGLKSRRPDDACCGVLPRNRVLRFCYFGSGRTGDSVQHVCAAESGCVAYGPADSNDDGDLICLNFCILFPAGASLGPACLRARLDFDARGKLPVVLRAVTSLADDRGIGTSHTESCRAASLNLATPTARPV